MSLTIENKYKYIYQSTNSIKNNNDLTNSKAKTLENNSNENNSNLHCTIRIDRENKTAYLDGVKMDEKFMDMWLAGKSYTEIMTALKTNKKDENTDESILKKIINS
ncbi:hypothetical protein CLOBY_03040 [Clostridium saccharobutylicum]|uniref:hypothetical protein n=1 Tax=Clostridium saccharobutylicum TaxID=169679 RepID=UPI000983E8A3|nr:hypothetical protein [Clostridium saccharobutylicum]AQS08234.1 hypothetical protein CLOBY_03040 [Clostridium saccharobutylicum]MBC2435878.1 hypothetical protein [Clostridium saccharobutylicum]NSB89056.1 hypothetical protein [Clostridium saccharobutylicum]NYC29444.1 hypothetical protein [Clostridium saccharobutylicum]OOM11547.1 hypothetical protein CLSAB_42410 [Clostridium saccharobutylicum]